MVGRGIWYSISIMKKQIISGFFIAQTVIVGFFAVPVYAATLPPSNPFYFVQDGVRNLRRAFTFSPTAKALLELRLVESRRMDLERIITTKTDNQVIFTGLTAYDTEVAILLEYVKGTGDNRVLAGVVDLFFEHTRFWNTVLMDEHVIASVPVRTAVIASRNSLVGLVTEAFGQNGHGAFRSRAEAYIVQNIGAYAELYILDALHGLSLGVVSADMTREIGLLKEDMAISLVGKLKKGTITSDRLSAEVGDPLMRLYSVAAMRERAGDMEIKNVLMLTSQTLVAQAGQARLMAAHEARKAIRYAETVADIKGGESDQVAYFLQQANRFMAESAYDLAFQHAILASGAATDALLLNTLPQEDLQNELLLVKKRYDAMRVKPAFIDKRIAAIADAIPKLPARETLAAIREVKLVLALLGS